MKSKAQQGFILIIVVVALIALSALALLLTNSTSLDRALLENQGDSDALGYIAEAGLQHAKWQLAQNTSCTAYTDLPVTSFGDDSYSATVTPTSGSPVNLVATATHHSGVVRTRKLNTQQVFQPTISSVLKPDMDTWIYLWKPTWNYGQSADFWVDNVFLDSLGHSLLKFDVSAIPAEATIISAMLELHQNSPSAKGGDAGIYRVTSNWSEGARTGGVGAPSWTERTGGTAWTSAGGDYDARTYASNVLPAGTVGWFSWDIADLVTDWTSGLYDNYGLMMRPDSPSTSAFFDSRDASDASLHPKLTITYACECGVGTGGILILQPGLDGKETMLLDGGKSAHNAGSGKQIWLSNDGTFDRGLLEFDLSTLPAAASVNAATLELYDGGADATTADAAIGVYRVTTPWLEGTGVLAGSTPADGASWDAYDGTIPWITAGGDYDTTLIDSAAVLDTSAGWRSFDVTTPVGDWVDATYPNYGFLLSAISGSLTKSHLVTSEDDNPALRPKLSIAFSCPCGVACTPLNPPVTTYTVLLVVPDASALSTQDAVKKALMEAWGFGVNLISAADLQAIFDVAQASADVAYVSEQVAASDLATKLRDATIGVVDEETALTDEFGISSSHTGYNDTDIEVVEVNHYITSVFATGPLSIATSATALDRRGGTLAPGLDALAVTGGNPSLAAIDSGGQLYDSGTAAGRRVQLPWGGDAFDINLLSADGQLLMRRALEWGAGEGYGSVIDPGYTEAFQPWTATASDSWLPMDLAPFGVPPNAVVEVAMINAKDNSVNSGGVRATGSLLDRRLALHEAESGGMDVMILTVQADAASSIEYYADDWTNLSFILLGYWGSGSFEERWDMFKAGASGSWQDIGLSGYGVAPGAVSEILLANNFASNEMLAGVRGDGSALARQFNIHEPEGGGLDALTLLVNAGGDAAATIEAYAQIDTSVDFYLAGYWSTPPGTYVEHGGSYGQVSAPSTWETIDLASFGVPANSVAQFVLANENNDKENSMRLREVGSTINNRGFVLQEAEDGGADLGSLHANVDSSAQVQWAAEQGATGSFFYPVGWWVLAP